MEFHLSDLAQKYVLSRETILKIVHYQRVIRDQLFICQQLQANLKIRTALRETFVRLCDSALLELEKIKAIIGQEYEEIAKEVSPYVCDLLLPIQRKMKLEIVRTENFITTIKEDEFRRDNKEISPTGFDGR